MRKRVADDQTGEVMIESVLVMIPTLFVLVFLMSLGFLLYQQWNVQYVADDIANKVSITYTYLEVETLSGTLSKNDIVNRDSYRYFDSNHSKYKTEAGKRGDSYGYDLLRLTSFAPRTEKEDITVDTEEDSFARRHVFVTVKGTYKIPFGEGLEIFGIDSTRTFYATSNAECVDLSDYLSTVTYGKNLESLLGLKSSQILGAIESWLKVVTHVLNFGA